MSHHGHYIRRLYIDPQVIVQLLAPPSGTSVRSIAWHRDRNVFCIYLDMPEEDTWWVDTGDVIPQLPGTVTATTDEHGGQRIRISVPLFEQEQDDAPNGGEAESRGFSAGELLETEE